jgi:hypothetical protein
MTTALIVRRQYLSSNASVRPETAGPIRKVLKMNLMIEELTRDRMRSVQRDAERSRAASRLRRRAVAVSIRAKSAE